eukprot:411800-Pyramimonas_sp.AAC.1
MQLDAHPQVEVICDCKPALARASSGAQRRKGFAKLAAHALNALRLTHDVTPSQTSGHEGHPWNEMSDATAQHARDHPPAHIPD